jgi:hypothetical protein
MDSDNQSRLFYSEVHWLSRGKALKRLYELRKEVKLFLTDKKSDLSHCFQDNKWVARLAYLSDIFSYINGLNLELQSPDTTIFNTCNEIELSKKKNSNSGSIWLQKETVKCFSRIQIVEADDFYSQNSVSVITAAHLKMMM